MAGGMAVLTGLVAVPAIVALGGFMSYRGRKELAKQQEVAAKLRAARSQYRVAAKRVDALEKRAQDAQQTLSRLSKVMIPLNGWLANLVATKPDYRDFSEQEREKLAVLVGLATATATVMQAPLLISDGTVNPIHAALMRDSQKLADKAQALRSSGS